MQRLPHVFPTVVHMLAAAVERAPDREALVCDGDRLTYAQYGAAVATLAREFIREGMRGERIAIIMPNSADLAVAIHAVLAAGAQAVPLNPGYTPYELRPILEDASPRLVLASPEVRDLLEPWLAQAGNPRVWSVGPGGRRLITDGESGEMPLPDPDTLGLLQYTGGTTGRAKGVELLHRATAINVSQREAAVPTTADSEQALVMTPLYHVYATAMGLFLCTYARGTMVLMSRYKPELALEAIERERITFLAGSPTIYNGLLACERAATTDFSSLSLCFSGASALSPETLTRWKRLTGSSICEGFGQTETGPVLAANPRHGEHKAGSVGPALPETEVEIVDPVTGEGPLPPGSLGEIRARGPQLMLRYRNLPQETAQALRDGWLYTGDIGSLDDDGYLRIQDRKKDLVIVSGFNVYPREIEECLQTHPDVLEAAAFGIPDERKGEVVHVEAVVLRDGVTAEELQEFLAKRLVRYKWPAQLKLVPSIAKTAIGKVDKAALRAAHLQLKRATIAEGEREDSASLAASNGNQAATAV